MYAFAQRADARVYDEPLYAAHIVRTGEDRPYKDKLLASMENDGEKVVQKLILGPCDKQVLFLKHMGKHIIGLDRGFLEHPEVVNVMLVREPHGLMQSYHKALGTVSTYDTCLPDQVEMLHELVAAGRPPIVVVSEDLLEEPRGMLQALCTELGLEFDEAMLSWEPGGRPEDGIWAYHWYANTHKATGFDPQVRTKPKPLPEGYEATYAECRALFDELQALALKPAA